MKWKLVLLLLGRGQRRNALEFPLQIFSSQAEWDGLTPAWSPGIAGGASLIL
jgi:hypothetical protein